MSAKYFYHSPRGFSNEAVIYAVPAEIAEDWASWFSNRCVKEPTDPDIYPVTRAKAAKLLHKNGASLLLCEDDYYWCNSFRLTPESVASALKASVDFRAYCEKEDAWAAEQDAYFASLEPAR